MTITFSFQTRVKLQHRTLLKRFIRKIISKEKALIQSLTYVFCSDSYILDINRDFLNHHFYTDIITFDLKTENSEGAVGEIYISTDRVKENAHQYHDLFEYELYRVIFHGVLHLCGYNDKKQNEKTIMREKEDLYIKMYLQFVSRETKKKNQYVPRGTSNGDPK